MKGWWRCFWPRAELLHSGREVILPVLEGSAFRAEVLLHCFFPLLLPGIGPGGGMLARMRMMKRMLRADGGAAPPVPSAVGGGSGKSPQQTCRSLRLSGHRAEPGWTEQVGSDLLCFPSQPLRKPTWTQLFGLNIDPGEAADRSSGWRSAVTGRVCCLSDLPDNQFGTGSEGRCRMKSKNKNINDVPKSNGKTLIPGDEG